eukprot:SM009104S24549  [mRNA]  locus=s9104:8:415:+ [translate_table: standard]
MRAALAAALRACEADLRNLLAREPPKAADRAQVASGEVRLPGGGSPTALDEQDSHIALKLSDDYALNEVDCVSLLVATHQEVRSSLPLRSSSL